MNNLCLTGNLGRDAETKFTQGGEAVTSFSVALSSGFGDKKITTWLNCNFWGKRGQAVAPHLLKGTQVAISGEFTARPYQSKEGMEKLSLELRVNDLTLIGSKREGEAAQPAARPVQAPTRQPVTADYADFDSDIPFAPHGKAGAGVSWSCM